MKTLITILLLLVSGVAHAEARITGAFGLTLGEVADENLKLKEKGDGYFIYYFEPKNGISIFSTYLVTVTPVKRLIYQIAAEGEIESGCKSQFYAFGKVLSEKYGAYLVDTYGTYLNFKWSEKKDGESYRTIGLWCAIGSPYELSLYYTDDSIKESITDELAEQLEPDNL